MNRRFVKKPIEIEAFRFGFDVIPEWFSGEGVEIVESKDDYYSLIRTLEGTMRANIGDFIIKGIKGEIYPCNDQIFWASYEEVNCHYVANVGAPFNPEIWNERRTIVPCSE